VVLFQPPGTRRERRDPVPVPNGPAKRRPNRAVFSGRGSNSFAVFGHSGTKIGRARSAHSIRLTCIRSRVPTCKKCPFH